MSANFKVGEIAIMRNDPAITNESELWRLEGEEVEIIRPARYELFEDGPLWCFTVRHASYGELFAAPHELRRRQPPTTGEAAIRAMFDAPPVDRRRPVIAWQAQYDTAQALMKMGVLVKPGKWPVEAA
jgi:hypothetical protein